MSSTCGSWKSRALAVGLVLVAMVCVGVILSDCYQWRGLDAEYLARVAVGASGYCCTKSAKTKCDNDSHFACAAAPVTCDSATSVDDTCGAANCSTKDDRSGAQCSLNTSKVVGTRCCQATGQSTTTGCPSGQAKCTFNSNVDTQVITGCDTGSSVCTSGQPDPSCE